MDEVYQVSSVPVSGIWCAYKLAPLYPFFPSFNVSEAKHGQNSVKILSTELGKFSQKGNIYPRINPKDPASSQPIEVDVPYEYRIKFQLEDGTVQTVYTNEDEAGGLLLLMSAQENIDKFYDLAIRGHCQAAMTALMGDYIVENSSVVEQMVKDFVSAPSAYCLDVGVLGTGETALVEMNDAFSIGMYEGMESCYPELLITRWKELTGGKK